MDVTPSLRLIPFAWDQQDWAGGGSVVFRGHNRSVNLNLVGQQNGASSDKVLLRQGTLSYISDRSCSTSFSLLQPPRPMA